MNASPLRYLIFDTESVADGGLVSRLRYSNSVSPDEAIAAYRAELLEKHESDFIPYTYQVPVSIVVGKVDAEFRLAAVVALDEPQFRPHVMTNAFWRGWEAHRRPTLVSFNGRGFDLPLLELAAFRFGISMPGWFDSAGGSYDQPRNRFNARSHIDLMELLTNFGSSRFVGGLNLAANLLGKPGKMAVQGHMVQDLFQAGRLAEINDYCRCDVLDTYFVFLRSRVLVGQLNREEEARLVAETKEWIACEAEKQTAFANYLAHWGDWPDPWVEPVTAAGQ
jgi:hypothetical protein